MTERSVWLYPQHEVLHDLIAARLADGQDIRFGVTAEGAVDTGPLGRIHAKAAGASLEIEAEFVVGADGSRSAVREAVAGSATSGYFREYPEGAALLLAEAYTGWPLVTTE